MYTLDMVTRMFKEEGGALFDSRSANLGHTLQGGVPTPMDRARAVRLAIKCLNFLEGVHCDVKDQPTRLREMGPETASVIVIAGSQVRFASTQEVAKHADMKNRRPKDAWWLWMKGLTEDLVARGQLV